MVRVTRKIQRVFVKPGTGARYVEIRGLRSELRRVKLKGDFRYDVDTGQRRNFNLPLHYKPLE